MSLLSLPNEVLLMIADKTQSQRDMNKMAQLNRFFYTLINKRLYAYNANHRGSSALAWATLNGQLATFQHFIKAGGDITKSSSPITHGLLHLAAEHGKLEVAQLLIDHGAKINRFNNSFETPLHLAATYGHTAVVDMLLKHGALLNENTNRYVDENPLHIAAKYGHTEIVRLLLQAGCNVHRTTFNTRETALHLSLKTVQYRSRRNNARLSHRRSQKGKTAIVLIEHGANIHSRPTLARKRRIEKGACPWERIDPSHPPGPPRGVPGARLYGPRLPSRIENAMDLAESRGNFEINQLMFGAMYPNAASCAEAQSVPQFEGWGKNEIIFDSFCSCIGWTGEDTEDDTEDDTEEDDTVKDGNTEGDLMRITYGDNNENNDIDDNNEI
ncbi:hypothetical protein PEBR_24172 [Penicillium brasilianum]|uniref:Uncharacterized protein n=1 Tax=Penicillium brasilianum TaxID=104259 RepID=A0A1S9RKI4_PENBI|nr:hypothetical protein PEBR_24172 [Penicillium brasilianum]